MSEGSLTEYDSISVFSISFFLLHSRGGSQIGGAKKKNTDELNPKQSFDGGPTDFCRGIAVGSMALS